MYKGKDLIKLGYRICSRCIYDESVPNISFDSEGVCNYCRMIETFKEEYKHVIIATQANHAISLVPKISSNDELIKALRSIPYESGRVAVHTDPTVMPVNRDHWSAFNLVKTKRSNAVMNSKLRSKKQLFHFLKLSFLFSLSLSNQLYGVMTLILS